MEWRGVQHHASRELICELCPALIISDLKLHRLQAASQMAMGPCYPVFSKTVSYLNRCYPDAAVVSELLEDKLENIKVRGGLKP